jgi:hypothetical protein
MHIAVWLHCKHIMGRKQAQHAIERISAGASTVRQVSRWRRSVRQCICDTEIGDDMEAARESVRIY